MSAEKGREWWYEAKSLGMTPAVSLDHDALHRATSALIAVFPDLKQHRNPEDIDEIVGVAVLAYLGLDA